MWDKVDQDIVRSQIIDFPSVCKIISAAFWQLNECFTKRFLTVSCGSLYRHPWEMTRSVCAIPARCDSFKENSHSGRDPLWTSRMWSVSAELISLWKAAVITAPLARSCSHHAQGAPSACSSWEKRLTRHFRWADYSIGPPVNGHSQDTSQCHSTSAHSDAFRYGTQRLIDYHPASYSKYIFPAVTLWL